MIPIDKGVLIPSIRRRKSPYPIAEMEVGDSFHVPAMPGDLMKVRNRLNGALLRFKRDGQKFTLRVVEGGVRVWRTA